ncbi:unnamed protein product [Aspergillus oryzae var. brunneus]|uniref:Unnamed protein product n=2 Tax=Aspergillus oryzae TaxID=5062 RepID=A0AAN4YGP9_ASPOZ|nr:unnamed protein product [Aspergillus oryzae]GMG42550.1 unnamed protein product [Aspergillus oryzae var. brunneus]
MDFVGVTLSGVCALIHLRNGRVITTNEYSEHCQRCPVHGRSRRRSHSRRHEFLEYTLLSSSFKHLVVPANRPVDNYLVQLDLSSSFSTDDGAKYKMSLVDSEVPKIKGQALWSDKANTTLFTYGGNYLDVASVDQGLWTYTIADGSWKLQQTSIKPVRLQGGGMSYSIYAWLDLHFNHGGLCDGDDSVQHNHGNIYTVGCAVYPRATGSAGISSHWRKGGPGVCGRRSSVYPEWDQYNFDSSECLDCSIAGNPLLKQNTRTNGIMHGSMILQGTNGTIKPLPAAWHHEPSSVQLSKKISPRRRYKLTHPQPGLSTYSLPSATANDIKSSPYPSTWADPALKSLFVQKPNDTTNSPDAQPDPPTSTSGSSTKVGPIVGGVVGGVAGAAIILAIIFFALRKRRRDYQKEPQGEKWPDNAPVTMGHVGGELPAEAPRRELDARSNARSELRGTTRSVYELDGGRGTGV